MKKFFFALMFVVTLTVASTCAAKDVWIDHWGGSDNFDIYVMDDTIISKSYGERFTVTTKFVRNGQLLETVHWDFNKSGMWRYETSTMNGDNDTSVIPRSPLFEFCMNRLGWSYTIRDMWYY